MKFDITPLLNLAGVKRHWTLAGLTGAKVCGVSCLRVRHRVADVVSEFSNPYRGLSKMPQVKTPRKVILITCQ